VEQRQPSDEAAHETPTGELPSPQHSAEGDRGRPLGTARCTGSRYWEQALPPQRAHSSFTHCLPCTVCHGTL